ncbi:MAG: ankyrin repeat domain-containing protein [Rickettsiales bacterium]|nr:MAG: ankyrin repeat domain-containing protein [Rickettsiales bacterium]
MNCYHTNKEIFASASNLDFDKIKKYLDSGGDINLRDDNNYSLLMLCVKNSGFDEKLACYLIDKGIQINNNDLITIDDNGKVLIDDLSSASYIKANILHMSYINGSNHSLFEKLLKKNIIDVNSTFDEGFGNYVLDQHQALDNITILHYTVAKNDLRNVKLLLSSIKFTLFSENFLISISESSPSSFTGSFFLSFFLKIEVLL